MDCKETMVPQCSIHHHTFIYSQDNRPGAQLFSSHIRCELEIIQSPATGISDQGTALSLNRKTLCWLEDRGKFLAPKSFLTSNGKVRHQY